MCRATFPNGLNVPVKVGVASQPYDQSIWRFHGSPQSFYSTHDCLVNSSFFLGIIVGFHRGEFLLRQVVLGKCLFCLAWKKRWNIWGSTFWWYIFCCHIIKRPVSTPGGGGSMPSWDQASHRNCSTSFKLRQWQGWERSRFHCVKSDFPWVSSLADKVEFASNYYQRCVVPTFVSKLVVHLIGWQIS